MKTASDAWYVRLPDGRILKASSTRAVRHHLSSGRIPLDSRVRRTSDEEWVSLELTHEFAELIRERAATLAETAETESADEPPALPSRTDASAMASRLDPLQLQTVGVRGFFEELLAALDSTLVRMKLWPAVAAALLGGLALLAAHPEMELIPWPAPWRWAAAGAAVVVVLAACQSLLTQTTYVELCRLRPARGREARAGWLRNFVHLALADLLVLAGAAAAIYGLRQLPSWLLVNVLRVGDWGAGGDLAYTVAILAAVALEVLLLLLAVFSLLLGPIVVVEEATFVGAVGLWVRVVAGQFGRVLLYEAMAVVVALLGTFVVLLPVEAAIAGQVAALLPSHRSGLGIGQLLEISWGLPWLWPVRGLALAPLIAYLAVANVFIYLNLRYEQTR
jgi:hypothetical protein